MNKNIKVLKEVCKGAKMGMDAIEYVSDKVEDNTDFKQVLKHDYSMYNNIYNQGTDAFNNYGVEPGSVSLKDKAMLWYGIQLNTLTDKTTSKIAELLMQGTNMGIIEGRRLINENNDLDNNISSLLDDFVKFQESKVEVLKKYL